MTKEEVEKAFNGVSPYYAYKQGIQDGMAYNEESFRREAAKDILANVAGQLVHDSTTITIDVFDPEFYAKVAVEWADALIAKLKEK